MEAGKRRECSNQSCKLRIFPRVDPVRSKSFAFMIAESLGYILMSLLGSLFIAGCYHVSH